MSKTHKSAAKRSVRPAGGLPDTLAAVDLGSNSFHAVAARVDGGNLHVQDWELAGEDENDCLRWAAQLHEIGLAVSHNEYHKHGAYLVENADMAGFSRQEQLRQEQAFLAPAGMTLEFA